MDKYKVTYLIMKLILGKAGFIENRRNIGFGFQVSGCRLQVAGCRFQVAGFRLQVAGCRLQASDI
ncbi:hypothetical protein AEQU2_02005 [Aequorivita lipolytica]|uniref:hypothetical protein n=1 Tax=Aequorivita lipolytica TaxID=153267 RepID=UPI000DBC140E|nr:hypothetical protein [Aequorivita lipolytica]SRX52015.1 hypothetical protein AEQU2_02005 [Aequorivita lipolytica]